MEGWQSSGVLGGLTSVTCHWFPPGWGLCLPEPLGFRCCGRWVLCVALMRGWWLCWCHWFVFHLYQKFVFIKYRSPHIFQGENSAFPTRPKPAIELPSLKKRWTDSFASQGDLFCASSVGMSGLEDTEEGRGHHHCPRGTGNGAVFLAQTRKLKTTEQSFTCQQKLSVCVPQDSPSRSCWEKLAGKRACDQIHWN